MPPDALRWAEAIFGRIPENRRDPLSVALLFGALLIVVLQFDGARRVRRAMRWLRLCWAPETPSPRTPSMGSRSPTCCGADLARPLAGWTGGID